MTRVSTLGEAGDLSAPVGSHAWAVAVRAHLLLELSNKESIQHHLKNLRDALKIHDGWKSLVDKAGRPFRSWEAFCKAPKPYGLGMPADALDAEVERRELRAKNTPGPGRGKKSGSDTTGFSGERGTAYILARLTRDGHAAFVEAIERGDLSAHAAALQVGYRKQRTPLEQLTHWWAKASPDERSTFLQTIARGEVA